LTSINLGRFDLFYYRPYSFLPEQLLRSFRDGNETNHALLSLDDSIFPPGKVNAERLSETAYNIENEGVTLCLAFGWGLPFVLVVRFIFFAFIGTV